jgi:hypothetical protein
MTDLQAGRIDFLCEIVSTALPQIQGGAVKAIATMTKARSPVLPDLPTIHEKGIPNFEGLTWNAFFLPKGTPEPIVKKLHDATVAAMETPAVKERLQTLGAMLVTPERRSPEYLAQFVASEIEKWAVPHQGERRQRSSSAPLEAGRLGAGSPARRPAPIFAALFVLERGAYPFAGRPRRPLQWNRAAPLWNRNDRSPSRPSHGPARRNLVRVARLPEGARRFRAHHHAAARRGATSSRSGTTAPMSSSSTPAASSTAPRPSRSRHRRGHGRERQGHRHGLHGAPSPSRSASASRTFSRSPARSIRERRRGRASGRRRPAHDPFLDLVPPQGVKLTPRHYAYLKISEGCSNRCSFCIIPKLRGDLVSRPPATCCARPSGS